MTKRAERANQRKKTQRFKSLRERSTKHASLYEAIERRERQESARLQAARERCIPTTGYPSTAATIERRRKEYLDGPTISTPPISPRAICASLLVAFALPIIIAIAADLSALGGGSTHVANVARRGHSHQARAANVAGRVYSLQTRAINVAGRVYSPQTRVSTPRSSTRSSNVRLALKLVQPPLAARPHAAPAAPKPFFSAVMQQIFGTAPPLHATPRARAHRIFRGRPHHNVNLVASHKTLGSPWSISPDGTWTAIVHAPSTLHGVGFSASTGQLIELEPSAIEGNEAMVSIDSARSVAITMSSPSQTLSRMLPAPDDEPAAFDVAAQAVGPYLVNIGWTPLAPAANVIAYKVYRSTGEGERPQLIADLPPSTHALHDRAVDAQARYRYVVVAETAADPVHASTPTISTPRELPAASASVLAGKGMFLYFSSLADDARNFRRYDPEAVIAEAHQAGIHVIELRMARGSCAMAQTPGARAWLNRLIDAAAQANISLIAWTVPRRVTTQDLSQTVAAAAYTTPRGNGFVGLALDLETGDHYMGSGAAARQTIVQYIDAVRSAVGQRYLIVATVASPEIGHLTNGDYPYAQIAAYADVLQPMEYWHNFDETSHHEYAHREVAGAAVAAVTRTRQLAGRDIPVDVAGQSVDLQGTGAPSGREILWSLRGAKSVGAIGETFFDWAGTRPDAWAAIQAFDW